MKPDARWDRTMRMNIETRLLDLAPVSYDQGARTVNAVLSMGSPVSRPYGTEVLRISRDAIDLSRVYGAGVPLLDSHQQIGISNALGVVRAAWIEEGALIGTLQFNQTQEGQKAEGMVARREINGISIGYKVDDWEISDADGDIIDPAFDQYRWADDDLTFTASRWSLLEISLCNVPADDATGIRAFADRAYSVAPQYLRDLRVRMWARQRMHDRYQSMLQHGFDR